MLDSKNCLICNKKFYFKEKYEKKEVNKACFDEKLLDKGFYLNSILKKKKFSKCEKNCLKCEKNAKNCQECNEKDNFFELDYKGNEIKDTKIISNLKYEEYSKFEKFCVKNDEKINGIYFDKETKGFLNCLKGCGICKEKKICEECDKENGFVYLKIKGKEEKGI